MEIFITTHLGNYNREAEWLFKILYHLMWYQFIVLMFPGNKFALDFTPRDK